MKPLAIDLFCGLGGWTESLLAEGYDVIGFDIEQHVYGEHKYPGKLVLQDVLTLHGSQFKDATLIVASPPCQEYSYMAMPWSRAKAKAAAIRADTTGKALEDLNRLFNACFRIQTEASLAAGRRIPMVVENVRGFSVMNESERVLCSCKFLRLVPVQVWNLEEFDWTCGWLHHA